jgi:hypothetical protein
MFEHLQYTMNNEPTTVTISKQQADLVRITPTQHSNRNLRKGVWELARLHTREAWLCWYPAGKFQFLHVVEHWLIFLSQYGGRVFLRAHKTFILMFYRWPTCSSAFGAVSP